MENQYTTKEVMQRIGRNVKVICFLKGQITITKLASMIGKGDSALSCILNGAYPCKINTLVRICNALKVDISTLFLAPEDIFEKVYDEKVFTKKRIRPAQIEKFLEMALPKRYNIIKNN